MSRSRSSLYLCWFVISTFFFYQYILRVSPGILVVELKKTYHLTAEEFSSLGSIYLYAYSFLQIPLGFLLDRVGVRRVLSWALLLCIGGTLLFSQAETVATLQWARFFVGAGSAPAFICALKWIRDFMPPRLHGVLMGASLSLGTIGALVSGKIFVTFLESFSSQQTLILVSFAGFLILLLILLILPSGKKARAASSVLSWHSSKTLFVHGMREIYRTPILFLYALIAVSVYSPLCVLADLWGTTFLMEKFHLDRATSAHLSLSMYGGLTIGSLVIPWLVDQGKISLHSTLRGCSFGLIGAVCFFLFAPSLNEVSLLIIFVGIGGLCGAEMLCFSGAAQRTSSQHSGLVMGVMNTFNMLGGGLIQQGIGVYVESQWKGLYGSDGSRMYSVEDLTYAFSLMILVLIVCATATFFLPKGSKQTPSH